MKIKKYLFIALFVSAFSFSAFAQTETRKTAFSLYGVQSLHYGQSLLVAVQNRRLSDSEIIPCIRVRVVFDVYEQSTAENGRLRLSRTAVREILMDAGEAPAIDFPPARSDS